MSWPMHRSAKNDGTNEIRIDARRNFRTFSSMRSEAEARFEAVDLKRSPMHFRVEDSRVRTPFLAGIFEEDSRAAKKALR